MKIANGALEGALAAQTSRAQEATRADSAVRRDPAAVGGEAGDSVQISSLSARVMDALSADEARQASRVAALAALYERGAYVTDSAALSRALVAHALGGAVDGEA